MYKVLVISHSLGQAEEYHRVLSQAKYSHVSFRYPANLTHTTSSLQQLLQQCKDVIQEEEIDTILALCPEYGLIQAALQENSSSLVGPKIESVFLCIHRYYNKRMVLQGFNWDHRPYEFEEIQNGSVVFDLDDFGGQPILKDSYTIDESVSRRIKSTKQFWKDIHQINLKLDQSIKYIQTILESRISTEKYPLAFEATCILEDQVPTNKSPISLHYVEACVTNDNLLPWIISDIFNFNKQKSRFNTSYVCVPTRLDDSTQYDIWAIMREIVQHLIDVGFNNYFIHAKLAVYKSGGVKVLDIVPGFLHANSSLYRYAFQGGDNIQAQIDLGLGNTIWTPRLRPGRCAMRARYYTTPKDSSLDDLVDVKAAKSQANVNLLQHNQELSDNSFTSECGLPIVEFQAFDQSQESCHAKIKELSTLILKKEKVQFNDKKTKDTKRGSTASSYNSMSAESLHSRQGTAIVPSKYHEEDFLLDEAATLQRATINESSVVPSPIELNVDRKSSSSNSKASTTINEKETKLSNAATEADEQGSIISSASQMTNKSKQGSKVKRSTAGTDLDGGYRLESRRTSKISTTSDTVTTKSSEESKVKDNSERRFSHV